MGGVNAAQYCRAGQNFIAKGLAMVKLACDCTYENLDGVF